MKYFNLEGIDRKISTSAIAKETIIAGTVTQRVQGLSTIPFGMELFKISFKKGELIKSKDFSDVKTVWDDYLQNQFVWPMMSERMMAIVEGHLTGKEGINWITAPVHNGDETVLYYVPRFAQLLDVLDPASTTYSSNGTIVVRPCFSAKKVEGLSMFFKRPTFWEITSALVIHEELMLDLKKAKLSGVSFSPACVS